MITSFKDLTLSKFREIQQIAKEGGDELEMNIRFLSVLSDIPVDELCAMPLTEVSTMLGGLSFLCEAMPEEQIAKRYKIGDLTLCPCFDITEFTTAQYVDFQEFMKAPDENQVGILSTLLIPKGKKYNVGYSIKEVREAIDKNISVTTSTALFTFFLKRLQNSIVKTLRSSALEVALLRPKNKEQKEQKEKLAKAVEEALDLLQRGDGSLA